MHTLLAEMAVMIWLCITARLLLCVQGCLWHILNMRRISCKVLGAAAVLQSLLYDFYVTPTLLQQPPSLLTAHGAAVPLCRQSLLMHAAYFIMFILTQIPWCTVYGFASTQNCLPNLKSLFQAGSPCFTAYDL